MKKERTKGINQNRKKITKTGPKQGGAGESQNSRKRYAKSMWCVKKIKAGLL